MAKDRLGHGSEKRGLNSARGMDAAKRHLKAQIASGMMMPAKPQKINAQGMRKVQSYQNGPHSATVYKNPEWGEHVVKFFHNGVYQSKADYHTDDKADAHSTAQAQLRHYSDRDAAATLAQGSQKSATVPTHTGTFQSAETTKRINEAEGSMSRLRTTFHQGNNRYGEYGKNTREAFDRHATLHSQLTGKPKRNIYD